MARTAYLKMIEVWLVFAMIVPFFEVILHTFIHHLETLKEDEEKGAKELDKRLQEDVIKMEVIKETIDIMIYLILFDKVEEETGKILYATKLASNSKNGWFPTPEKEDLSPKYKKYEKRVKFWK